MLAAEEPFKVSRFSPFLSLRPPANPPSPSWPTPFISQRVCPFFSSSPRESPDHLLQEIPVLSLSVHPQSSIGRDVTYSSIRFYTRRSEPALSPAPTFSSSLCGIHSRKDPIRPDTAETSAGSQLRDYPFRLDAVPQIPFPTGCAVRLNIESTLRSADQKHSDSSTRSANMTHIRIVIARGSPVPRGELTRSNLKSRLILSSVTLLRRGVPDSVAARTREDICDGKLKALKDTIDSERRFYQFTEKTLQLKTKLTNLSDAKRRRVRRLNGRISERNCAKYETRVYGDAIGVYAESNFHASCW